MPITHIAKHIKMWYNVTQSNNIKIKQEKGYCEMQIEHGMVLKEIILRGQGPEKEMAVDILTKKRRSENELRAIYKEALKEEQIYSNETVSFMRHFVQQEKEQKAANINVRLTQEERKVLEERAQQAGISLSQYIRKVLFPKGNI